MLILGMMMYLWDILEISMFIMIELMIRRDKDVLIIFKTRLPNHSLS